MSSFKVLDKGCNAHYYFPRPDCCRRCVRAMAVEVEKKIDLAIAAEITSKGVNANDTLMAWTSAATPTFQYPPPPTTEEEDRLASAAKNYTSPFPLIMEYGYDPESLALEPYERSGFQAHPLHKDDESYYPERLALEPHEGGTASALDRQKRAKHNRRAAIRRRAAKPRLTRQKRVEEVPEDTIVVDVDEDSAREISLLRKALKRSEAKLALAKGRTALLADLKNAEEEEKSVSFAAPAKKGRKRKASSEPEEAPQPRRRSSRSTRSGVVSYAE